MIKLQYQNDNKTIIKVKDLTIGDGSLVFIAGPCAVENDKQIELISKNVKEAGANILRGGSYKLRTSPYSFQGLGLEGLKLLKTYGDKNNMPVISEITSIEEIKDFIKYVDIIQVGARNMQNYELLKELGKIDKPILLKRGFSATYEEWLDAAEYILSNGNPNVILCERGIRTFETKTRNTLDLSAISYIKNNSCLPIIVDPSHATGNDYMVKDMALAAIAAGADGLMIEVHDNKEQALSDKSQAISSTTLKEIINKANNIKKII